MTRDEAYQFCLTWAANDRGEVDVAMVDALLKLSERSERRAVMLEREACAQIVEEPRHPDGFVYDIIEDIRSRP